MADFGVLTSREPLNRAELQRTLEALPRAFDQVEGLDIEESADVELPEAPLPVATLFQDCLMAYSVTGVFPGQADVRAMLTSVLVHDFSKVAGTIAVGVQLALDIEDEDEDGIDTLGIHVVGSERAFELGATGSDSADARAAAFERAIDAAGLPLRLTREGAFAFEHTAGLAVRTKDHTEGFPPGNVRCVLHSEPLERSVERLFSALAASGVPVREATWSVSTVTPPLEIARVEASYRALAAASFPARYFRGSLQLRPTVPHGVEAIATLEPFDDNPLDHLAAEASLGHNRVSVMVRPCPGGHRVILIGTHPLDAALLERRLGLPWVPLAET